MPEAPLGPEAPGIAGVAGPVVTPLRGGWVQIAKIEKNLVLFDVFFGDFSQILAKNSQF